MHGTNFHSAGHLAGIAAWLICTAFVLMLLGYCLHGWLAVNKRAIFSKPETSRWGDLIYTGAALSTAGFLMQFVVLLLEKP